MNNELLLLSGGLDSAALAWSHRPALVVTVDYGQRAACGEVVAASAIAAELRLTHEIVTLRGIEGMGALASDEPAPSDVPAEFWPFRNQLLVSIGASVAAAKSLVRVVIGSVAEDGQYADGTASFIDGLNNLMRFQERPVEVSAPAMHLASAELLRQSGLPAHIAFRTTSCSRASVACGRCASCRKSRDVLREVYPEHYGQDSIG